MKRLYPALSMLVLFSLACSLTGSLLPTPESSVETGAGPTSAPEATIESPAPAQPPSPGKAGSPCGDGVCNDPENARNCPADCAAPSSATEAPVQSADSPAVLYFGVMVHLEGWDDHLDQARFERHAQLMREYASLFETYGAKLTWESKEVTDGALEWGDNVLLEMQQRGHGVGVHADIGGQKNYDCSRFSADLRAEKEQLESLGVTVRHVSGIVSHCDWVTAASDAGYLFTTGNVAYAVMSMPPESRPAEYRDCQTPAACHDVFPAELEARLHPWRANSGADWLTNAPNGKLVILPSSGGLCVRQKSDDPSCDAFFRELEQAIALSQPGQVNAYYVSWSLGQPIELDVLEAWLQRMDAYVRAGQVEWKTLPEMYDAYTAWEAAHPGE
ncbi:MAG: hypothetical protein ACOYYU_07280 [Chloroflexota bacterium]